nr:reverse transcriptase domain-containing protein [Tanacetum cinerariifolium]
MKSSSNMLKSIIPNNIANEAVHKVLGDSLDEDASKQERRIDDIDADEDITLVNVQDDADNDLVFQPINDQHQSLLEHHPMFQRIIDWKIYKEGKKSYYQIIRADRKLKMYMFFSQMLTSFNREDLKDLYKLVKAKYGSTRPVEDLNLLLWGDLKTMFEPHVEDAIWRKQQGTKFWNESYMTHVEVLLPNAKNSAREGRYRSVTLYTNDTSSIKGPGAGLLLIGPSGVEYTYAPCLNFDSTNNEAKYEALLAGLRIARKMKVHTLEAKVNSKLLAGQINREYVASSD